MPVKTNNRGQLVKRLRNYRLARDLTLKQVADQIGVSTSTYRDWEYGKAIRGEPYVKLANAFGVTLEELLLEEAKKTPGTLDYLLRARENIDLAIKSAKALRKID